VAAKEVRHRGGWTTYTDLNVLSRNLNLIRLWEILYEYTIKVTAVCAFAYAASLMTMIGTCHLMSRTQVFSPAAMQSSLQSLYPGSSKKPTAAAVAENNSTSEILEHDQDIIEENLNERLRMPDLDETRFSMNKSIEASSTSTTNNFGCYQQDDLLKEHVMMSRLTRALFALKIGSFRDLMIGPQLLTAFDHV